MEKKVTLQPWQSHGSKKAAETVYIYVLRDPRTHHIRYIGSTKNPRMRLYAHCHDTYLISITRKWTQELAQEGLDPIMIIIQKVPASERNRAEHKWAQRLLKQGHPMLNMTEHQLINRQCKDCGHRWAKCKTTSHCPNCDAKDKYFVLCGPQMNLFSSIPSGRTRRTPHTGAAAR